MLKELEKRISKLENEVFSRGKRCVSCNEYKVHEMTGDLNYGVFVIKDAKWDECSNCGAQYPDESSSLDFKEVRCMNNNLLTPRQIEHSLSRFKKSRADLAKEIDKDEEFINKILSKNTIMQSGRMDLEMRKVFLKWEEEEKQLWQSTFLE